MICSIEEDEFVWKLCKDCVWLYIFDFSSEFSVNSSIISSCSDYAGILLNPIIQARIFPELSPVIYPSELSISMLTILSLSFANLSLEKSKILKIHIELSQLNPISNSLIELTAFIGD